jgi:uncharacterized iron-regulated membrane protein
VRRLLFWMHLGAGVLVSSLVIFFATTGALLAYERPLVHAADRRSYQADPVLQEAVPLPLDTLLAHAVAAVPARVEMLTVYHDASLPLEMLTSKQTVYFVNRYTDRVQGPASPHLRAFFAEVTALHRWFGLSNAQRATVRAVKGLVALLLLFLLLSGSVLWIPRRWNRSSLRTGTVPRLDASGRARNYNWHKVTGFWTALPLAVIVTTGVIMAYPWANAMLFRLARSPLPMRGPDNGNSRRHAAGIHPLPTRLDEAFTQATSDVQDWRSATLRLPLEDGALNFIVDRSESGHPEEREMVSIDPKMLQVLHRESFAALSRGQRWRSYVRFAHTGEAAGWWGESLALVSACGAVVLSITGIAMSLDRVRRWRG